MADDLPSNSMSDDNRRYEIVVREWTASEVIADLKVFWGPEICRLEYLVHLVDTGRIKDEGVRETA